MALNAYVRNLSLHTCISVHLGFTSCERCIGLGSWVGARFSVLVVRLCFCDHAPIPTKTASIISGLTFSEITLQHLHARCRTMPLSFLNRCLLACLSLLIIVYFFYRSGVLAFKTLKHSFSLALLCLFQPHPPGSSAKTTTWNTWQGQQKYNYKKQTTTRTH